MNPELSIIIPTLNEERIILALLEYLRQKANDWSKLEIIIVDGGSKDATIEKAKGFGAKVLNSKKGRAVQQNLGAKHAMGKVLYFLHADTFPPQGFDAIILKALDNGFESGCFRMKFDTRNIFLRFFAWFTRFNHILCRGGDQSLYLTKQQFDNLGGFNERYLIYEDSEFIRRVHRETTFKIHPENVITSARKYREKGWLHVQFHFAMIHFKNYLGNSPEELFMYYKKYFLEKK